MNKFIHTNGQKLQRIIGTQKSASDHDDTSTHKKLLVFLDSVQLSYLAMFAED